MQHFNFGDASGFPTMEDYANRERAMNLEQLETSNNVAPLSWMGDPEDEPLAENRPYWAGAAAPEAKEAKHTYATLYNLQFGAAGMTVPGMHGTNRS
jgi:hypothetical protein